MLKLTEIVPEGGIVPAMKAPDRDAAVAELIDALVEAGAASEESRDDLLTRVLDRERKNTTGFGCGVAVPHVKHRAVERMAAAIGLSKRGVDFSALDKQPVYTVVLLLSPEDRPEEHLQAMEVIFRNLSKDTFRRALRQVASAEEVRGLLRDTDGHHLGG